jgi:signal transduction histidine kinase
MRVLIAEDGRAARLLLQLAVERLGHECLVAADGAQAWRVLETEAVDAVISDWLMPKVDGLELCRRVRARRGAPYTYFVVLTALTERGRAVEAMRAGADDFLVKPLHVEDLTARLIAAERVTTAQRELVAAERAKAELVEVLSHELRTPLAGVVGYGEILLAGRFGAAERREYLTIMVEEGRRVTALIDDFLELQRGDGGHHPRLATAVTAIADLLLAAATSTGDDPARPLRLDLPDQLPLVAVDADRIHQVLTNLIVNARKYSPDGGPVTLAARAVDGEVEISVADHGLGIPAAALPHVFDRFYRVDTGEHDAIKGTGLGLAICRSIARAHGGRVRAESDGPGRGSVFTLTLPAAAAPPSVWASAGAPRRRMGR